MAIELQSFVDEKCRRATGVIIHVNERAVEMMTLEGDFRRLAIADIDAIYTYNVLENPFPQLEVGAASRERLKEIYLEDSAVPQAVGWPVRFIEDLVIFLSVDGRTHVHGFEDIYKLRPAAAGAAKIYRPRQARSFTFDFPELSARCNGDRSITGSVKPTRILADKISIDEYFSSFARGYDRLEGFQERTYLYAKPFLFDRNTRLGFSIRGKSTEPQLEFPLYFQWSSGHPYQFQSFNVIGSRVVEFSPNAEPVFTLRSDVKSHVFHALFVGNVLGIPAGESIYLEREVVELKDATTVQPGFNYIALMGGDFGPLSLSTGFFYPSFAVKVGNEKREVLGSEASYATRFMYTKGDFRARVIGSYTKYDKDSVSGDDIFSRSSGTEQPPPEAFTFENIFLRGGVDYRLNDHIATSLDGILNRGRYEEFNLGIPSFVEYNKLVIQGHVKLTFGDYVALGAYASLHQHNYEATFFGNDGDLEKRETNFFGTFEFIF